MSGQDSQLGLSDNSKDEPQRQKYFKGRTSKGKRKPSSWAKLRKGLKSGRNSEAESLGSYLPSSSGPMQNNFLMPFPNNVNMFRYIHEIAVWKSKALSLEAENRILHNIIKNMQCGPDSVHSNDSSANDARMKEDNVLRNSHSDSETESESGSSDLEFEVDDDMLNFLEKTERFRMERDEAKKLNSKQNQESLLLPPPKVTAHARRLNELQLLYGDDHKKILGMETSMELNFDRFMDKCKPVAWPNLSFTL